MNVERQPEVSGTSFCFGKERRILRRSDFLRVQALGERVSSPHFVLLIAPREAPGPTRLGVVVTKKIGHAPQRSRVKRLCRECFRLWPDFLPPDLDLVVIARQGAPELSLAAVREQWARARPALLKRCQAVRARPGSRRPS